MRKLLLIAAIVGVALTGCKQDNDKGNDIVAGLLRRFASRNDGEKLPALWRFFSQSGQNLVNTLHKM